MTTVKNSCLWSINQCWLVSDAIAIRIVVNTTTKAVDTLSNAKSRLANSAAEAHFHKLSQRLVGIFLDPLWSWPRREE